MSRLPNCLTAASLLLVIAAAACSEPDPAPSPPKAIRPVTSTTLTGTVGTAVQGGITVHVVDYSDRDVIGAKVGFSIVAGDGSVSSRLAITDAAGLAHTEWTLGETAGTNEVVASIFGVDSAAHFVATGQPGAPVGLTVTPRILRILPTAGGGRVGTAVVDQFGNAINSSGTTYTSRNTGVVTVDAGGFINVVSRGASTYVTVSAQGFLDSALVVTLSATDPPCTGIQAMAQLAVGEVKVTGFADNGICVPALAAEREYAIVPFFDSPVPSAQTTFMLQGFGVKAPSSALGSIRPRTTLGFDSGETVMASQALRAGAALDNRLRIAEQREMTARAAGAREWYARRSAAGSRRATFAVSVPSVGDQIQLNVNSQQYCESPTMRTGRVVAVTAKAVVVADLQNPAGFTDAEYTSFGVTFDTLVYPSDVGNFGAPTDVDENGGRVIIFFTHAVNEISSGTLGFAYSRDLLPKSGPLGSCPGSNVAELLYLYVPDANTSPSEVKANAVATLAHEFQHVINSARRLYLNPNAAPVEERWLNEGLSHVAEELLFYRSTKLAPRQNLGFAALTSFQTAYFDYQRQNFNRFNRFIKFPETQGPVGLNDEDDDLETRGAVWSFLRYAADQRFGADEAAFWRSLVDANSTGLTNLYEHVGGDVRLMMRDWALSNFLDDLIVTQPQYRQPSWNLRQIISGYAPVTKAYTTSSTPVNAEMQVTLRALSSAFVRFGVGANQEAYVSAAGFPLNTNAPLPRGVLLAIVRTK